MAEDAIRAVRAALQEGIAAGGGAAYMACIPALARLESATGIQDEALGVRVVAEALKAPLQQIAANAGYAGSTVSARVSGHYNGLDPAAIQAKPHSDQRMPGDGFGFDALSGQVVSMWENGIVDAVKVLRMALEKAASTAAMGPDNRGRRFQEAREDVT